MHVMQNSEILKQKKIEVRDYMDLQKFGIKLYLNTNGIFNSKDFIPEFHNWIQGKVVSNHLLIDVADYSHIPDGPGVMLVAHEGHFSLDQENLQPGIMYMRKTEMEGSFKERFIKVLSTTIQAANLLCDNNINQEIDIIKNSFRFISNDRRVAENTLENQNYYQDEVQKALVEKYPESNVYYEDSSSENERLAFTVNLSKDINILDEN